MHLSTNAYFLYGITQKIEPPSLVTLCSKRFCCFSEQYHWICKNETAVQQPLQ